MFNMYKAISVGNLLSDFGNIDVVMNGVSVFVEPSHVLSMGEQYKYSIDIIF